MGLFDSLFGTSSKATSNTQGTQNQNETQNQNTTGTQNSTTNQNSNTTTSSNTTQGSTGSTNVNSSNVTSSLDAGTIATIQKLLGQTADNASAAVGSGASPNADSLRAIAGLLANKGNGGDASALGSTIAAQQGAARQEFAVGEGQQAAIGQQAIGSKNNTFSQGVQLNANSDLEAKLAQISAAATLQSQQQSSADLTAAGQVLGTASAVGATDASAAIAPVTQLADILKGAQTTSNATQAENTASNTEQATNSSTLEQLLQTLGVTTNQNVASTGTTAINSTQATQGKQSSTPGVLPAIFSLFGG
jgi:hypothetical protein